MPQMKFPQFVGASYKTTREFESQRTINLYPEISEVGGTRSNGTPMLRNAPGLLNFTTLPGSNITVRGIYYSNTGRLFVCAGSKLYEVDSSGSETELFSLETTSGNVSMIDDRTGGLVLVDGSHGYYLAYKTSGTVEGIWPPEYLNMKLNLFSANHGLTTGDQIILSGIANYKGTYTVTVLDKDTLQIDSLDYVPGNKARTGTFSTDEDDLEVGIVTIESHGYNEGQEIVFFSLTETNAFNGKKIITNVTENTFEVELKDNTVQLIDEAIDTDIIYTMTWELTVEKMTEISSEAWRGSDFVEYQDGYFIFTKNTDEGPVLYFGEDPLNLDPLDFNVMEDRGDNVVRAISDHGVLWVLRDNSAVVYYNTGDADNVWQPQGGSKQETGCVSGWTVQKCGGRVIWLASDERGGAMVMATEGGYSGARISTHAVERALSKSNKLSEATAWSYQLEGHAFYCLNVPDICTTWVYDVTTGVWCERGIWRLGRWERDPVEFHVYAFGKHITSAYNSLNLWYLDNNVFTQYRESDLRNGTFTDQPMVWLRQTPFISNGGNRVFFNAFELFIETGQPYDTLGSGDEGGMNTLWGRNETISFPTAGQTFTPAGPINPATKFTLSWSDDGGHRFSGGIEISAGAAGDHSIRSIWRRLGCSRNRIFRILGSVPVSHSIIDAFLDIEQGAH